MLPSSSEIQYFLEVATTLNISRAAERLGVTQPTLSLSIQRLEQSLGAPLLLRGKTGVRLTKAGARFALEGKALIDQWQRLRTEALSDETAVKGRVSVGFHPSVALYSVGGFAADLLDRHPDLEFVFHHDLSRRITERVISFEIDLGIVVNPVGHPDLRLVQLCADEVGLWRGPKSYVKDVLICDPDLTQAQSIMGKLKKMTDGSGHQFKRFIHSASLEVVSKLVADGAGVGILPKRVATREAVHGLRPLLSKGGPVFQDKICLVYRPVAQRSLAARTVMQTIEQSFRS